MSKRNQIKSASSSGCPDCGHLEFNQIHKDAGFDVVLCGDCGCLYCPDMRENKRVMCDDCAFRKGSPERQDPWAFMKIIEATVEGDDHPFYCHKGEKCKFTEDTGNGDGAIGYDIDITNAHPCAGWRAFKAAHKAGRLSLLTGDARIIDDGKCQRYSPDAMAMGDCKNCGRDYIDH